MLEYIYRFHSEVLMSDESTVKGVPLWLNSRVGKKAMDVFWRLGMAKVGRV